MNFIYPAIHRQYKKYVSLLSIVDKNAVHIVASVNEKEHWISTQNQGLVENNLHLTNVDSNYHHIPTDKMHRYTCDLFTNLWIISICVNSHWQTGLYFT